MVTVAVNQIVRKAPRRVSPAVAVNGDLSHEESGLFAGVADWPHIDEMFASRSLSILASSGISTWYGAGGCRGYDGRLGFGAVSSPALEIVRELADTSGGFQWTDDAGVTWAVRFADDGRDPDHPAFAVNYRGSVLAIDAQRWRPALQTLKTQVAHCSRPGRFWDDADRAKYASLARALRSVYLADGAVKILEYFHQIGAAQAGHVLVSTEELAAAVKPDDEETRPAPSGDDLAAMLRATMGFQIARLKLGTLGWNPGVIHQSAAISDVELCGDQAFRIHVAPMFLEVAAAFFQAVHPPRTQTAKQNVEGLARSTTPILKGRLTA